MTDESTAGPSSAPGSAADPDGRKSQPDDSDVPSKPPTSAAAGGPEPSPSPRGPEDADEDEDEAAAKKNAPRPNYGFLVVLSAIFLAIDLGTKEWAVKRLENTDVTSIPIIEGILEFDLAKNRGGAWGAFGNQPDYVRLPFFFFISALAVVFIVSLYRKLEPRQTALKWALPLVLGGAFGNLVDRIRHQYVVDFIDVALSFIRVDHNGGFHFFAEETAGRAYHWPTFNVADIWICVGVGLMAIDMFTPRRKPAAEDTESTDEKRMTRAERRLAERANRTVPKGAEP